MTSNRITLLAPAGFRRSPWKNGGGVTIDFDGASRPGHPPGDWGGLLWRFGRTAIVAPGPFSDLAGCDRMQVVVRGTGLVLDTPQGEVDLRRLLAPMRYRGEAGITSRLESGPVEVVNLIADRSQFEIDLVVPAPGSEHQCRAGTHIFYASDAIANLLVSGVHQTLAPDHALRLDAVSPVPIRHMSGRGLLLASIYPRESA